MVAFILVFVLLAVRYRVKRVISAGSTVGGRLARGHGEALDQYLKGFFIIDLISLIILLVDIWRNNMGYFLLLFLLKIPSAFRITTEVFYKLLGHKVLTPLVRLLRIVFLVALVTFLFGSFFTAIDLNYLSYPNFQQ